MMNSNGWRLWQPRPRNDGIGDFGQEALGIGDKVGRRDTPTKADGDSFPNGVDRNPVHKLLFTVLVIKGYQLARV